MHPPRDLNMSVALKSLSHSTRLGGWENSDWMSSGFDVIVQSKCNKQGDKICKSQIKTNKTLGMF